MIEPEAPSVEALQSLLASRDEDVAILTDMLVETTAALQTSQIMFRRALALWSAGVKPGFPAGVGAAAIREANAHVEHPTGEPNHSPVEAPREDEISW